jgi:hypothetical protein
VEVEMGDEPVAKVDPGQGRDRQVDAVGDALQCHQAHSHRRPSAQLGRFADHQATQVDAAVDRVEADLGRLPAGEKRGHRGRRVPPSLRRLPASPQRSLAQDVFPVGCSTFRVTTGLTSGWSGLGNRPVSFHRNSCAGPVRISA